MYCTCHNPQPMKNDANGVVFTVCAKSKGGCGEEINTDPTRVVIKLNRPIEFIDIKISVKDLKVSMDKLEQDIFDRLGLSSHGPCDYAGCGAPGICSHQNTQYVNERSNYSTLCEAHQIEVDAYWEEMWKDYWSGRL